MIPDPSKTLNENAIEPWGMTKGTGEYYRHVLEGLGDEMGFDLDTPWKRSSGRPVKPLCMGVISRCRSRIVTVGVVCANIPPVSKAWLRTLMRRHDENRLRSDEAVLRIVYA